jgi:long-chain fatty acid transport protein
VLSWKLLFPGHSFAGSPVHGSKAAAMGTAFVGIADDPSAILYNPAGLTNLEGTNVYSGATAIILSSECRSPSGQSEDTEFQIFFPPHLYLASDLKRQNMVFGLGIYSPFGIGGREWSETGLTQFASTENTISTLAANPVFAWRPLPWLSLGAGFYYMRSESDAERMIDQSSLGASDGRQRLETDGGGWGYNLGVLLFQGEKVSLGFAYRSHSKIDPAAAGVGPR